jgi:hypothetical protein
MKKKQLTKEEVELLLEVLVTYFMLIKPTSINYRMATIEQAKKLYKKLQS